MCTPTCPPTRRSKDLQPRRRPGAELDPRPHSPPNECYPFKIPKATTRKEPKIAGRHLLHLSPQTFVLALSLAVAFAFTIGTVTQVVLFPNTGLDRPSGSSYSPAASPVDETSEEGAIRLPEPTVSAGKDVPLTTFTTKTFEQEGAITSHTVHLDRSNLLDAKEGLDDEEEGDVANGDDELHLPAGQHLLVDIKNVDAAFLNSEERLAEAMIELVNESKLTLLSYHCHSLVPTGVSCAGVLLESHVAFHTWPKEGVIALDLFTCGAGLLIPVLPLVKQMFGIPLRDMIGERVEEPAMLWSHKLRGFRDGFSPDYKRHENPLEQDLSYVVLSKHDLNAKEQVISEGTDFQHVDVYQSIDPKSRSTEKTLFLDGVQQSSLRGEAAYHEALVHPAMLAHPNPKRVAIIGGGEGATLREVLKHETVEEAMMVEIDEGLVELCREYLPEWSDCSDIVGSDADSCFDDSRANVAFEDAFAWFIDAFGEEGQAGEEEKFDVIIMDALDPDQLVEIVGSLYKNNEFVDALFNGLSGRGVFVIQLGEADSYTEAGSDMYPVQDSANMMKALQSVGFESIHTYDEAHSHFFAPWSYLVCFKDSKSRANWYKTPAEIKIELHRRLRGTESGRPALSFFDGPTMAGYQVPARVYETVYCRNDDRPQECDEHAGIDPNVANLPTSRFEARKSEAGEHAGRGLFAAVDIPEHSRFDIGDFAKSFHVSPSSLSIIEGLHEWAEGNIGHVFVEDELYSVDAFVHGYGYSVMLLGERNVVVDSGIHIFCNHGCNGTYSWGDKGVGITEMNADVNHVPEGLLTTLSKVYSPVFERHLRQISSARDYALRDIGQGEEILCNYLTFVGDPEDWEYDVKTLRGDCSGEMGHVAEYEFNTGG